MTDIWKLYRAGRVRRWHTNADLSHIDDYIDGHSGRVARLCAFLWRDCSADLLRAALSHDDGEWAVGDMPATAKRQYPDIAGRILTREIEAREYIWGDYPDLTNTEYDRLHFADRLDAYMTAARHAPHVMSDGDWPEARRWLIGTSHALGVAHLIERAL